MTAPLRSLYGPGWYASYRPSFEGYPEYTVYIYHQAGPIVAGWIERAGGDGEYVWYSCNEEFITPEIANSVLGRVNSMNVY